MAIATSIIKNVPAKIGTAPNAPDCPAWSARSAVCGDHCRPKRKSKTGTLSKKRKLSKSSDMIMPKVVKTAMTDSKISVALIKRSTWVRARNCGVALRLMTNIVISPAATIAPSQPSVKGSPCPPINNPAIKTANVTKPVIHAVKYP